MSGDSAALYNHAIACNIHAPFHQNCGIIIFFKYLLSNVHVTFFHQTPQFFRPMDILVISTTFMVNLHIVSIIFIMNRDLTLILYMNDWLGIFYLPELTQYIRKMWPKLAFRILFQINHRTKFMPKSNKRDIIGNIYIIYVCKCGMFASSMLPSEY